MESPQAQPISKNDLAPIAVFAYNRPAHLARLIHSLERCEGFSQSPVTIFVDGPRSRTDRAAVEEVQALVTELAHPNVGHVISPVNKGLRNSVFDGVSKLMAEHDQVIVLEDDLVLSPIALSYFNRALDFYAADSRVWSISGYIPDVPRLRDFPRALILPSAHSWGWATWRRAWKQFDLNARPRDENLQASSFRQAIDMNGYHRFRFALSLSIAGYTDSWYLHWLYTIIRHGGRSVFPPRRVLDNYGVSAGTHGGRFNPQDRLVKRPPLLDRVPDFENADEVDYFAVDMLKHCWEARVHRLIPLAGSLKRRLRRLVLDRRR
ncbi:hypothetical protein ABQF17_25440 [Mycolicibacterium elephantis]